MMMKMLIMAMVWTIMMWMTVMQLILKWIMTIMVAIMIIAVIVSILIMMAFATPVRNFVNKYPTIQMLALSFLILIGFMLVIEGAHLSHAVIFKQQVGAIPKGYLYFAIAFSLGVEALNMRLRKKGINT